MIPQFAMNYKHGQNIGGKYRLAMRPELVQSGIKDTMSAIQAGKRTNTIRWGQADSQQINQLQAGDPVRFYSGNDKIVVRATPNKSGQVGYTLNPDELNNRYGDAWLERLSELEGWDVPSLKNLFGSKGTGQAFQYEYLGKDSPIVLAKTEPIQTNQPIIQVPNQQVPSQQIQINQALSKTIDSLPVSNQSKPKPKPVLRNDQQPIEILQTNEPVLFDDGSIYPEVELLWNNADKRGGYAPLTNEGEIVKYKDDQPVLIGLNQTLADIDAITQSRPASVVGDVIMKNGIVYDEFPNDIDGEIDLPSPSKEVDAAALGMASKPVLGKKYYGGREYTYLIPTMRVTGKRDTLPRDNYTIIDKSTPNQYNKGVVRPEHEVRFELSAGAPDTDLLSSTPQWALQPKVKSQDVTNRIFNFDERDIQVPATNQVKATQLNKFLGIPEKKGRFTMYSEPTTVQQGNKRVSEETAYPGLRGNSPVATPVGEYPLSLGASQTVREFGKVAEYDRSKNAALGIPAFMDAQDVANQLQESAIRANQAWKGSAVRDSQGNVQYDSQGLPVSATRSLSNLDLAQMASRAEGLASKVQLTRDAISEVYQQVPDPDTQQVRGEYKLDIPVAQTKPIKTQEEIDKGGWTGWAYDSSERGPGRVTTQADLDAYARWRKARDTGFVDYPSSNKPVNTELQQKLNQQLNATKQLLINQGMEVETEVSEPVNGVAQHTLKFTGNPDLRTQMELNKALANQSKREYLHLPPNYSIAPQQPILMNRMLAAEGHTPVQKDEILQDVKWEHNPVRNMGRVVDYTDELTNPGKKTGLIWQGQPIVIDESVSQPTLQTHDDPVIIPKGFDPEIIGLRQQWKAEREANLRERAAKLLAAKQQQRQSGIPSHKDIMQQQQQSQERMNQLSELAKQERNQELAQGALPTGNEVKARVNEYMASLGVERGTRYRQMPVHSNPDSQAPARYARAYYTE